ncbi:spore coat protein [Alkalihalobacillus oceani]|uniref:spore coat protein n=1 Tax=Halalkalibacter oceani TaxID=1653776 RepID=UPI00203FD42C|nr:CotD family spore coat protein [Halalkalibacter oceani]MCM3762131.1 spore coat protein [Halalkalibacter oceani]
MHCPPRVNHCPPRPKHCQLPTTTQVLPAKVHPTQHNIVEKTCEYIVPEVYPTHTTNVTNHVYKHVSSFPQTQSFDETISNQQFVAPSQGFGGGPVAGAMAPPRPNMMGMGMNAPVMGAMSQPNAPVMGAMSQPNAPVMGAMHQANAPVMGAMNNMKGNKSCGC